MINVVLDTSIYTSNPLNRPLFKAVERLLLEGSLKLHIPYVVERERQTQLRDDVMPYYNDAVANIKKLKKNNLPETITLQLDSIYRSLIGFDSVINNHPQDEFSKWLNGVGAERWEITGVAAKKAFECYFNGQLPVTPVKNREDIPDAFIKEALIEILEKVDFLHAVVNDKSLRRAVNDNENMTTYSTLNDFISSDSVQRIIADHDLIDSMTLAVAKLSEFESNKVEFSSCLEGTLGEALIYKTLRGEGVPGNEGAATINRYGEVDNLDIHLNEASYLGDGVFHVVFQAKLPVTLNFYLELSDYMHADKSEISLAASLDSYDRVVEVEKEYTAKVIGFATLRIDVDKFNKTETIEVLNDIVIDDIMEIELDEETLFHKSLRGDSYEEAQFV